LAKISPKITFALEFPVKISENYPDVLKEYWGVDIIYDPVLFFSKVQSEAKKLSADFVSVYFNIENEEEIAHCKEVLFKIQDIAAIPLIVKGTGQKSLDALLVPELISVLKKPSVIAFAQDLNYKPIINAGLEGSHTFVLRTPIDINLTKELNILSTDLGLSKEKILIDPDMGCVGYGLDYGYSIIERIKLAREAGDRMLDMPIIVFSGEESFKAKEAKSKDFAPSWGELETRSVAWEIATTTSLIYAGANAVVVWHPKTIETLKPLVEGTKC